jgi:ABC-2 type transport system ATP-binding protein
VLLTTHDISDIEALCSRVVMLDQGKVIYDGGLQELRRNWAKGKKVHFELAREVDMSELKARTAGMPLRWERKGERQVVLHLEQPDLAVSDVLAQIVQHVHIVEMQIEEVSTEEIVRKIYQEGMTLA